MMGLALMIQRAVIKARCVPYYRNCTYERAVKYAGRCLAAMPRFHASGHRITRIEPLRETFWFASRP